MKIILVSIYFKLNLNKNKKNLIFFKFNFKFNFKFWFRWNLRNFTFDSVSHMKLGNSVTHNTQRYWFPVLLSPVCSTGSVWGIPGLYPATGRHCDAEPVWSRVGATNRQTRAPSGKVTLVLSFLVKKRLLTGVQIRSQADALAAIDQLHATGVPTVILSSSDLGDSQSLLGFGSSIQGTCQLYLRKLIKRARSQSDCLFVCLYAAAGERLRFRIEIPRFAASFTGTGDLFTALLLAWMAKTGDLKRSCDITVSTLQAVLKRTLEYAESNDKQPDLEQARWAGRQTDNQSGKQIDRQTSRQTD